jgi:hypothetical protein
VPQQPGHEQSVNMTGTSIKKAEQLTMTPQTEYKKTSRK